MSINKVIYGNDTLVDLTEDTVAPETLLSGATAHSAAGNQITGTAIPGHTIISSSMLPIGGSALPMAGRGNLQFGSQYDPIFTEDDPTNNKTIVHGQLFICDSKDDWNNLSDADFKAKYGANRVQVGLYWYLPWANSIAYQTDLTPIGTVLSLAVDTTNTTLFPADLIEFPNKDYVICRGATVKITDYPALYQYFEDEYGDGNYFGTAQTAEGYFVLPNWSADFPTNGVLVIKARVTSDVITIANVDETGISSRTDEVPSCARVAGIEEDISEMQGAQMSVNEELGWANGNTFICTYGAKGLQAWTCMSPFSTAWMGGKYVRFKAGETYRLTIRNNLCRAMKIGETSFKSLVSYIDHIDIVPLIGTVRFYFTSAPYGTSDCCLIIGGDLSIKRIS